MNFTLYNQNLKYYILYNYWEEWKICLRNIFLSFIIKIQKKAQKINFSKKKYQKKKIAESEKKQ